MFKNVLMSAVLLFVVLWCCNVFAREFTWDANNESDLAGYKFYHSLVGETFINGTDVGNVTEYNLDESNLPDGDYKAATTAYDTSDNESLFSNEVLFTVDSSPPNPPMNFREKILDLISRLWRRG